MNAMDTVSIICIALIPVFLMGVYILYLNREGKNIKESMKRLPGKILYLILKAVVYVSYVVAGLGSVSIIIAHLEDRDKQWLIIIAYAIGGMIGLFLTGMLDSLVDKHLKPKNEEEQE